MASFRFFRERIEEEEEYLVGMYGRQYVDYQARVPSGIPFITGSVNALSLTRFREFAFTPLQHTDSALVWPPVLDAAVMSSCAPLPSLLHLHTAPHSACGPPCKASSAVLACAAMICSTC
jgi:hypothetical protein